jgi:hypothetical protein
VSTAAVERVVCGRGGYWLPASVLQWAIAQVEASIDPGGAPSAGR